MHKTIQFVSLPPYMNQFLSKRWRWISSTASVSCHAHLEPRFNLCVEPIASLVCWVTWTRVGNTNAVKGFFSFCPALVWTLWNTILQRFNLANSQQQEFTGLPHREPTGSPPRSMFPRSFGNRKGVGEYRNSSFLHLKIYIFLVSWAWLQSWDELLFQLVTIQMQRLIPVLVRKVKQGNMSAS